MNKTQNGYKTDTRTAIWKSQKKKVLNTEKMTNLTESMFSNETCTGPLEPLTAIRVTFSGWVSKFLNHN